MSTYLAMDVGGTFVKYALMDENGNFLEHGKTPTIKTSTDDFFESLYRVFDQYKGKIDGIAFCMPGRIDYKTGYAYTAGALTRILKDVPVGERIRNYTGLPVTVGNDGKCAAAAELWSGSLQGIENSVALIFGTGIGGGVIINGKVYMGSHFVAGELSNIIYDNDNLITDFDIEKTHAWRKEHPNQPMPKELQSPIYSKYAATSSLLEMYAAAKGIDDLRTVNGEAFFEAYRNQEPEAVSVLQTFTDRIAAEIISIQAVIDVERIAIGGGISGSPELLPAIQESAHKIWAKLSASFPCIEPEIVRCKYGNDANLLGALKLHLDH